MSELAVPIRAVLEETAYAKINLALHVRARRDDGYHELETLFAFVDAGDRVSLRPSKRLTLTISGPFGAELDSVKNNLVRTAARTLLKANHLKAGASLHLEKNLPVAAGIGGGSADAAAALRLLERHWKLGEYCVLPVDVAPCLGADVPACLASVTQYGAGIGEKLNNVDIVGLAGTPVLLVNPGVACPTGPVFAGWDQIDRGPLDPANYIDARNDLTDAAIALVPQIGDVLALLSRQNGVRLARMSGSGATCFALFDGDDALAHAETEIRQARSDWWTMTGHIR